jgi:hypothetical protein
MAGGNSSGDVPLMDNRKGFHRLARKSAEDHLRIASVKYAAGSAKLRDCRSRDLEKSGNPSVSSVNFSDLGLEALCLYMQSPTRTEKELP